MGRVVKDLTGQKFARLTVIERGEDYVSPKGAHLKQWLCKCDCGNKDTILVISSKLKRGEVKSCGCLKTEDLTGQKFGKLLVLEKDEEKIKQRKLEGKNNNNIYWKCECDCGNKTSVYAGALKSGHTQSCGCLRKKEKEAKENLTGMKFNRLTVIKRVNRPSNRKNTQSYWSCQCDCGNERKIIAGYGDLKSGNTQSCGCLEQEMASEANKKYNTYDFTNKYGIGYTAKGEEFYFDLEDYDKIKDYCWCNNGQGYIVTNDINQNKIMRMHRIVMNCPDDMEIDHIFQNRYDNRKEFLRLATRSQNEMNIGLRSHNTSGVTGVCWNNRDEKWNSYIGINRNKIKLGCFNDFDEAVQVRKEAETKYFGEYKYKGEY